MADADSTRRGRALKARLLAAKAVLDLPSTATHSVNSDESLPGYPGNFAKALPHTLSGNVDPAAYTALRKACTSGAEADFALIPLGGVAKLANPEAAWAFSLEAGDPFDFVIRAAPSVSSAETAGEMVELYWHALLRDVPFADYLSNADATAACVDLSLLSDFRGPKQTSATGQKVVTPSTLFRGSFPGSLEGPLLSQYLFKTIPFGPTSIPQRYAVPAAGVDFMTTTADWLSVQNGAARTNPALSAVPRHLITARDLGEYVHTDFSYQTYLNAALILLGAKTPLNPGNPYRSKTKEAGFATFGAPHVLDMVARIAVEALRAAWCQKWAIHRRLRPEEFGGLVQTNVSSGRSVHPIHSDVIKSDALKRVRFNTGTALLPMAFAEGCPTHPAYPAGHATIAGACVTVLKAFFDANSTIASPVEPSADGSSVLAYTGGPLTVAGELNKLAANISLARNMAGVHWRSDGDQGMLLGEEVALSYLRSCRGQWNEAFTGCTLTRFNGTVVTV
ncbi:MAG: vanadium-dependent haloperoxidase [Opitutaceae bacterium]